MTFWSSITGAIQTDEQWVVAEIAKGWADIQTFGQTIQMDVKAVETWIASNHAGIISLFQGALTGLEAIGSAIPMAAPEVAAATLAIDAATAAVDTLSKHVLSGTTPISTVMNTYHAVKDAQTAVTAVLKAGTAPPASLPEAAHLTPVIVK
jgi:hypothetical protein